LISTAYEFSSTVENSAGDPENASRKIPEKL